MTEEGVGMMKGKKSQNDVFPLPVIPDLIRNLCERRKQILTFVRKTKGEI